VTPELRPLADADEAFVVALYRDRDAMAPLAPLDAGAADRLFARARDGGGDFHVVLVDGVPAGVAGLVPRPGGWLEAGLVLVRGAQSRGVGRQVFASLISRALADAACSGCRVRHAAGHAAMAALARRLGLHREDDGDGACWTARRGHWQAPVAAGILPAGAAPSPRAED